MSQRQSCKFRWELEGAGLIFVEPNLLNSPGIFTDTRQAIAFAMTKECEKPCLEKASDGGAIVRAYTDLKRHNLCDDPDRPDPLLLQ